MKKLFAVIATLLLLCGCCCDKTSSSRPYWLDATIEDPHLASKVWFKEAKFGLFVHFTLASLLEYGKEDYEPWSTGKADDRALKFVGVTRAEYQAATTPQQRAQLIYDKFLIPNFDAEEICRLAKDANMSYINFTTMHIGGCYNFNTSLSDFNSVNSPAKRDLVAEMVAACNKYKIPLFLYVPPQISNTKDVATYKHNVKYLTELLTQYGDVAGIWFDGIGGWRRSPSEYMYLSELHQLVRRLQPHALVSFKEGALGDEDFISPEHYLPKFNYDFKNEGMDIRVKFRFQRGNNPNRSDDVWENIYKYKLREMCAVMQECYGRNNSALPAGWVNDERAERATADDVYELLTYTRSAGSNLVMNIGLRADGSIHPDDKKGILGAGEIINKKGWPKLSNEVLIPEL